MLKWTLRILLLLLIILILYILFVGLTVREIHIKENYLTHETFVNSKLCSFIILPKTAQNIEVFIWPAFDTNYQFVRANAELKTDFLCFVKKASEKLTIDFEVENVPFEMNNFEQIFNKKHIPIWWDEQNMKNFNQNYLIVEPNQKGYGSGFWYFYNQNDHVIKVFHWSQQHLSAEHLKQTMLTKIEEDNLSIN